MNNDNEKFEGWKKRLLSDLLFKTNYAVLKKSCFIFYICSVIFFIVKKSPIIV